MSNTTSHVRNRNGIPETTDERKILARATALCEMEPPLTEIDPNAVTEHVAPRIHSGVTTQEIDDLTARYCATNVTTNLEYERLAARVVVSDLHKEMDHSFTETTRSLRAAKALGQLDARYVAFVERHGQILDMAMQFERDYEYTYFGLQTLLRAYLLRIGGKVVESPQHMIMRVAVFLHANDERGGDKASQKALQNVLDAYDAMSRRLFTHATPTLFNAGGVRSQLLSCFLLGVDDSVQGIYKAIADCASISKYAGGIGIHIQGVRGNNSTIRSINGSSSGIGPMCRVFETTALHVNQAGRRNGSFAMYITPWHVDILSYLHLKRHQGEEQLRARTLHYAVWVSDRFMRAVRNNEDWHLFCPDECREISSTHGTPAFDKAYDAAVHAKKSRGVVKAQRIWEEILTTQTETGEPYIVFADAANAKSNQKNLGQIRSSNLCVAAETPLLTHDGWHPIRDLCDKSVEVWNGHEFASTTVRRTGTNQPLLHVRLDNGATLDCTPYHRFRIQKTYQCKKPDVVEAKDLKPGMMLAKCDYPVIDGTEPAPYAYTHGLFCADGTYAAGDEPRRCSFAARERGRCGRHLDYPLAYDVNEEGTCGPRPVGRGPCSPSTARRWPCSTTSNTARRAPTPRPRADASDAR